MQRPQTGKLYLTDKIVKMPRKPAFVTPVGAGCKARIAFEGPDEMRLVSKRALVGNGGQRKITGMHQLHCMNELPVKQHFFCVHAGKFQHGARELPCGVAEPGRSFRNTKRLVVISCKKTV